MILSMKGTESTTKRLHPNERKSTPQDQSPNSHHPKSQTVHLCPPTEGDIPESSAAWTFISRIVYHNHFRMSFSCRLIASIQFGSICKPICIAMRIKEPSDIQTRSAPAESPAVREVANSESGFYPR